MRVTRVENGGSRHSTGSRRPDIGRDSAGGREMAGRGAARPLVVVGVIAWGTP
jgi:hypothetical protein